MTDPTQPKFETRCEVNCSLDEERIGHAAAVALLGLRERGLTGRPFMREASAVLGRPITEGVARRHSLKHYRELETDERASTVRRATDLEILDGIIESGFRNSKNWKPSIKDTLDAMKLKVSMTGGSAFDDMMQALDAALDLRDGVVQDEGDAPEAAEALGLADELGEDEEEVSPPAVG